MKLENSLNPNVPNQNLRWAAGVTSATIIWFAAYIHLEDFADFGLGLLGLSRSTALGEAIHFFLFDTPKVMLLLTGIVFVMGIIQTFFAPERTRALLSGKRMGVGNILAASLGIVTPFCSCSAVPLFIGFLSAGVPLGVTFSFLISAPMVNEVALALLFGMFGWKVAGHYLYAALNEVLYSSLMAENQQRHAHMDSALNKLDEDCAQLRLAYNAQRQEDITEEIEVLLLSADLIRS